MTRLLDLNDYAIGLPAIGPNVDVAYADERRWDEAADRAADLMQDAEAIAQYADDGGSDVSLPAELADLVRIANAIPAANLTVRPKLLEAIGESLVSHVEAVLCAREYRVIKQSERFSGRDFE